MYRYVFDFSKELNLDILQIILYNYIHAKKERKPFALRLDDTKNIDEQNIQNTLAILGLFNLEYNKPYYLNSNLKFYRQFASKLLQEKKAYLCFCETKNCTQRCKELSDNEVLNNEKSFYIRINYLKNEFIILNLRKYPSFEFACAIDDMIQNVNHIIDTKENSHKEAKQEAVKKALGYNIHTNYTYLPKISSPKTLMELLEDGFLPSAIANYLINGGEKINYLKDFQDIELKPVTIIELDKIKKLNQFHMEALDEELLTSMVGFSGKMAQKQLKNCLKDVYTLNELKQNMEQKLKKEEK